MEPFDQVRWALDVFVNSFQSTQGWLIFGNLAFLATVFGFRSSGEKIGVRVLTRSAFYLSTLAAISICTSFWMQTWIQNVFIGLSDTAGRGSGFFAQRFLVVQTIQASLLAASFLVFFHRASLMPFFQKRDPGRIASPL